MQQIPVCLEPNEQFLSIDFDVPALACDTHAHVVSPDFDKYPLISNRTYTPVAASEEKYLRMLSQLGMQRGVLVQISTYGTDNRYMLETLARHPNQLRGIAVVDKSISSAELQEMHDQGVRGVRINTLFKGGIGYDQVEAIADLIGPFGWHLQFLMSVQDLPVLMPIFSRLPVPGVVDHIGYVQTSSPIDGPEFQSLCQLVRESGWWVKLSGAYRMGASLDQLEKTTPFARQLFQLAPERMVWGSDWPHVHVNPMPDTGMLLNLLKLWIPNEQDLYRVLVENPACLYDF